MNIRDAINSQKNVLSRQVMISGMVLGLITPAYAIEPVTFESVDLETFESVNPTDFKSAEKVTDFKSAEKATDFKSVEKAVSHNLSVFLVKNIDGVESLEPLDTAQPKIKSGDVLEYQTKVSNNSPNKVKSMLVTVSIPKGTILIGHTLPVDVSGSLDNVQFYPTPLRSQENGVTTAIPLSNYQSLRWQVKNLDSGKQKTVSYRAKLN